MKQINITIDERDYSIPLDTKLGDHLYHHTGEHYFIDTKDKMNVVAKKIREVTA